MPLNYNCCLDTIERANNLFILTGQTTASVPTVSVISAQDAARVIAGMLYNICINETAEIDEGRGANGFANIYRREGFFSYPAYVYYPDSKYYEMLTCCNIRRDQVSDDFLWKINQAITDPDSQFYDKALHTAFCQDVADIVIDPVTDDIKLVGETGKIYYLEETEDAIRLDTER